MPFSYLSPIAWCFKSWTKQRTLPFLPDDILLEVVDHLDLKDLKNASLVSRRLLAITAGRLWRSLSLYVHNTRDAEVSIAAFHAFISRPETAYHVQHISITLAIGFRQTATCARTGMTLLLEALRNTPTLSSLSIVSLDDSIMGGDMIGKAPFPSTLKSVVTNCGDLSSFLACNPSIENLTLQVCIPPSERPQYAPILSLRSLHLPDDDMLWLAEASPIVELRIERVSVSQYYRPIKVSLPTIERLAVEWMDDVPLAADFYSDTILGFKSTLRYLDLTHDGWSFLFGHPERREAIIGALAELRSLEKLDWRWNVPHAVWQGFAEACAVGGAPALRSVTLGEWTIVEQRQRMFVRGPGSLADGKVSLSSMPFEEIMVQSLL